jgi:hypothetical protein
MMNDEEVYRRKEDRRTGQIIEHLRQQDIQFTAFVQEHKENMNTVAKIALRQDRHFQKHRWIERSIGIGAIIVAWLTGLPAHIFNLFRSQ